MHSPQGCNGFPVGCRGNVLRPRVIFAERFGEDIVAPYARRTSRPQTIVHHLGLALSGRPGQGLALHPLKPVSRIRCFGPSGPTRRRRGRSRGLSASTTGRGSAGIATSASSATCIALTSTGMAKSRLGRCRPASPAGPGKRKASRPVEQPSGSLRRADLHRAAIAAGWRSRRADQVAAWGRLSSSFPSALTSRGPGVSGMARQWLCRGAGRLEAPERAARSPRTIRRLRVG
jgi:hypothetical protein